MRFLPAFLGEGEAKQSISHSQDTNVQPFISTGNIHRKFTQLFRAHYEEKQIVPPLHYMVSIMVISQV